jgi:hypothetical protein
VRRADVEGLDRDLGRAGDDERARQAAGPGVELRLGDERAPALDPDDLAVVLEDRERLADDDAAHAEAAREFGLGRQGLARGPRPGLDLLLEHLLQLVVQRHEARAVKRPAGGERTPMALRRGHGASIGQLDDCCSDNLRRSRHVPHELRRHRSERPMVPPP